MVAVPTRSTMAEQFPPLDDFSFPLLDNAQWEETGAPPIHDAPLDAPLQDLTSAWPTFPKQDERYDLQGEKRSDVADNRHVHALPP
jgi:hypothetical protein